jgi:hypothetical protein
MKLKIFNLAFIVWMICSCSKEDNSITAPVDDPIAPGGKVLVQGALNGNSNYKVSGIVKVIDDNGTKSVRLENFSSSNGPDLKVYLSKDASASSFINLGDLKSTSGNQNYAIPGMPVLPEYPYVLIWCQQFGVLFGAAELK